MPSQRITDEGDLRKWRTELPNLIDDIGLTPYERALYGHYKRVCGAVGGQCEEGTKTTADRTCMSMGQVSACRKALADKGLIAIQEQPKRPDELKGRLYITIIDIWELNFTYYACRDGRPDVRGWTVQQVNEWAHRSYSEQYHSLYEQQQPPHCSPGEIKKEHVSKKEQNHGASAQEQLQRPPMLKAKPAPKSAAPEQPEPGDGDTSRLLNATPARIMLRDKFHESVTHPDGHSAPKKFPTLAMALEFDKAAERLNSHLESAINYALGKGGINTITRLVNYLANFDPQRIANGGKNNVSPNSRRISRPVQPYTIADPAAFTGFGSDD